jgi:hypothetical protein
MLKKAAFFLLLFVFAQAIVHAQKNNITLSGFISDKSDGERLPGATVLVKGINKGGASNTYGFYSISLPTNKYQIVYSFIGYANVVVNLELSNDTTINIELGIASKSLEEVEITGQTVHENITSNQMSVNTLTSKTIQSIPMLMGEVDIIKALQLLPGVKFVAEGSSGFSVRGGSPDQNLVQLDEATVYNAGHLMGFFSVFNNDAVKSVQLYKGDLPAQYGGRLSSLVDVRMKEGNNKKFHGNGGIGLIASRLTLEGPIAKNKASFMISGRRTYADLFLKLSKDETLNKNALYFYDINAKVNWSINQNNHVFLSGYFGKDVLKSGQFNLNWGNATGTLRWNHIFHEKLFSNFTVVANRFNYSLGIPEPNLQAFEWKSDLSDYTFKGDFTWYANTNNTVRFGVSSIYHNFYPGIIEGLGDSSSFSGYSIPNNYALESGVYVSNNQKIGSLFILKYGLRLSMFNNIGPGTVFSYDELGHVTDSVDYPGGEIYNTYLGLEPRLGIVFKLNEISSIKASYSRNFQYIQQAENSTGGSPLSIWFPASQNVKPQIGNQFALGYFRNFKKGLIETSVEAYYKNVKNAIDFKDHADLLLNKFIEGELLFGKGWSYGVEFLVKKISGNLSGWVSYTWSRTLQQIQGISNGDPYPASYDRPHDFSIVANYNLGKQISFGATWVYLTGQPITFPIGRYVYGNTVVPVYSERNSFRMPDYHRLDISVTWRDKEKPGKKWHNSLNFSIYNVYNRKNPWVINFQSDPNEPNVTYAEVTYLFGIIPSITYNFRF